MKLVRMRTVLFSYPDVFECIEDLGCGIISTMENNFIHHHNNQGRYFLDHRNYQGQCQGYFDC